MLLTKIDTLTPEQEALIPIYREKWRAIALSTEPVDRKKAKKVITDAYAAIGKKEPRVRFFRSPQAALRAVISEQQTSAMNSKRLLSQLSHEERLRQTPESLLGQQVVHQLKSQIDSQLSAQLKSYLENELEKPLWNHLVIQLRWHLISHLSSELYNQISPEVWASYGSWLDFCICVLNCTHNQQEWNVFQEIAQSCGWFYPFEKIAIVCDRPIKLSFDEQHRLHREGAPAIQFADQFQVYAYEGVSLPGKYGQLPPSQWQAHWILQERNVALRRILMQGIGYARMCQELQTQELDSWQKYTLLKIDAADVEPIYLLKMTCPSTQFVHVLRVSPDVQSAKEAISWVNWGTAPEEFSVQT